MLEQIAYQLPRSSEARQRIYTIADLDSLSASALYSNLTIRPLGSLTQLHIHEGVGGTAHIKTWNGGYQNLNSYDAAMLDLGLDKAGIPKIQR